MATPHALSPMKVARLRLGGLEINLALVALGLLLAVAPLMLGRWQLARAELKESLEARYVERLAMRPIGCAALMQHPDPAFVRVHAKGRFEAATYWLDNRTHDGVSGIEVLTVFRCVDGERFLVNRGWLATQANQLPQLNAVVDDLEFTAFVSMPYELSGFMESAPWPNGWPKRIAYLDMDRIRLEQGGTLAPFPLIVESGEAAALEFNFQPRQLSPNKHYGYAVQWLAIALGIIAYLSYRACQRMKPSR